jgi:predicted DNA binding protein
MSTILKASVPAEQFAMAETFETLPAVEFDTVRIVTQGADRVTPLLWAMNAEADRVREAMAADGTTADVRLVSRRAHDSLFQLAWTGEIRFLREVLLEHGGAIVSAHGSSEEWTFKILFADRESVSSVYDSCEDIEIRQIQSLDDASSFSGFKLTDEQFTTVSAALEEGYYSVPRRMKLEDLATELDISHQALSERLRRGHRTLIETVVAP